MTLPQGLMDGDKYAAKEAHIRKKNKFMVMVSIKPSTKLIIIGHKTLYLTCEIRGPWVKVGANMAI